MKVGVMDGGTEAFNNMVDSSYDPKVLNFIQNGYQKFANVLSTGYESFMDRSKSLYEEYNGADVIQRAKSMLYNISGIGDNTIRYLDADNIYNPNDVMKRYIMAQPDIYKLNQTESCNAYSGIYVDVDPCALNYQQHVDYTRVMNGVTQYDTTEESNIREDLIYYEDNLDIPELHFIEQTAILNTWDRARELMNDDLDPTDLEGGEL